MSDTEGVRPTDPTCSVPGCSNPATTTALQDGAPVCRECADKAARRWEAQEREDESEDALDSLLPAEQVGPAIRAAVLSLFAEGRARAVLSTPAVLRTCQALSGMDEWAGLNGAIKAIIARQAGLLIGRDAAAAVLGTFDRRSRTWADAPQPAAPGDDEGEPWEPLALDNGAFSEPPVPLAAVGRGLLLFGRAVVSVVTHGKQGKTTAIWADMAPVTHRGRVLAIVGARELGPDGRAGYAREIVGLGGDPRNVDILEPVSGTLARLAGLDLAGRFAAVVVDSAASVCEAEGYDENQAADVDPMLTKIGAWGLPAAIVRHAVNTGGGQSGRDSAASTGAGSRRWLAGVDGEAVLKRDGNRSVLTWRGRTGLPDATAFTLDKGSWPWCVTVEADPVPTPSGPGGGGETVTDEAAEAAVLQVLRDATPDQPMIMGAVKADVCKTAGRGGASGQFWRPFRDAIDRLYKAGRIDANRDPGERRSGARLQLWTCGQSIESTLADRAAESVDGKVGGGVAPTLSVHTSDAGGEGDPVPAVPETPAPKPGGGVQSDMPAPEPPRRDPEEAPSDVPAFDPRAAFLAGIGKVQKRLAGGDDGPAVERVPASPVGRCGLCKGAGVPIAPGDQDEADICVACDRRIRAAWAYTLSTGEAVGPLVGRFKVESRHGGGLDVRAA